MTGKVYLVGAGPGDPGLITVKGRDCLRRADAVVYDALANPAFLEEAPPEAERIFVGKSRGRHHRPQEQINTLLADLALQAKTVVRLKGGDPYVFGRGGEEAMHLADCGIPFEVVPGITAGFAAAAYAGIPLTHRDFTTSLALVTGHEHPDKKMSSLDWEKLATGVGTLVFYMGMANLELIARELIAHGRPAKTPVAIVQRATTPHQRTLSTTLGEVVERVRETQIKPPAVIIVGEVVRLREALRWFDNRPLFGRRVLVTRAADQAASFAALLESRGAEALICPTIATVPPESWQDLDREIANLPETDVLILTSAHAVDVFFARLRAAGRDLRALAGIQLAVVGPKTGRALEARGLTPELIPPDYRAEGVIEMLRTWGVAGKRVLYPRAELARDIIPRELAALGAEVADPVAYRTVAPAAGRERLLELLAGQKPDVVTFTASSTVDNFVRMVGEKEARDLLKDVVVASIGPLTSAAARRYGLEVTVEPADFTLEALTEALVDYFANAQP